MHEIKIHSRKGNHRWSQIISCPSTWAEVTPKQVLKILPIVLGETRTDSVMVRVLSLLIKGVPPSFLLTLPPANVAQMIDCVKFVFEEGMSVPVISEVVIRGWLKEEVFAMPAEKLENITCFEWWVADDYYSKFMESHQDGDLDKLVATLLREVDQDKNAAVEREDMRVQLRSRMQIDKRVKKLRKLDPVKKAYILYFFSNCKKWIYDQFGQFIFEDTEDESEGTGEGNPLGWYGLFQKAAETGVFGTLDNILFQVKFLDFCTFMVAKRLEHDRLEREQQRLRAKSEIND